MLLIFLSVSVAVTFLLAFLLFKKTRELNDLKQELNEEHKESDLVGKNLEDQENTLLDPLTNLFNFQAFENRLHLILNWSKRYKSQFAVVFINIRHFSSINNSAGYEQGNLFLKAFAEKLKLCVRQIDTVCRYGGDKFLLILPQLTKPEMAAAVAQRIEDCLNEPIKLSNREISASVNMGISVYPIDGSDNVALVKNAHIAANQAKTKNSAFQFFNNNIHALGEREQALLEFLQSGEYASHMHVNFFPYVNTSTDSVFYIHAKPQLVHPIHGLVMMEELYKLAERTQRAIDVYEFLFRKMAKQFESWRELNFLPQKMAVTVSLKRLEDKSFIDLITNLFPQLQIPLKLVVFQISESSLESDPGTVFPIFELLSKHGIEIAIDIFALGHFVLKNVHQIPIDYLRIDENITRSFLRSKSENSIFEKVSIIANKAGIKVLADGVENSKEQEYLEKAGCRIMGGKLFDRYLP